MISIQFTKRKKEVASARSKFSFVNLNERNPCSVKYECHVCEFVFLGLYCDQGSTKTGIFSQISIRRPISDKSLFLLLFTSIVRTCTHTLCLTHRTANSYQFSKTLTMPQYTIHGTHIARRSIHVISLINMSSFLISKLKNGTTPRQ